MTHKYLVFAFYPYLRHSVRTTTYTSKCKAYEYISALKFCGTPYCVFVDNNLLEYNGGESCYTKKQLGEILDRFFNEV